MATENVQNRRSLQYGGWAALLIGVATFVLGIALLVSVFLTAKNVFASIDSQLAAVRPQRPVKSSADGSKQPTTPPAPQSTQRKPDSHSATVRPGGPTVANVAASIALKLFGLLVLGWIAAMIAARGAALATGIISSPKL
ncbi:MAG: hypothetical protein H5T86_06880 [Armatimonadetes bacterium]|nr:hypothetical protein [Armatimonadota bacterium]